MPELDMNSPDAKRISDELRRALADELLAGYAERLERDVGVTHQPERLESSHRRRQHELSVPMQIEPSAEDFAERYARGEAQVVWTTLVADLETPVSAFIKIAGGKPMSFLLGIGGRRRHPRPLFHHRT